MSEQPFCLPRTAVFHHPARAGNRDYHVYLALPQEKANLASLPVIYLLDAESSFATLVETMRRGARHGQVTGIGEAAIVGISRHCAPTLRPQARREDFVGDADTFRRFIVQDVGALLAEAGLHGARRAMIGHSLGALFMLEWVAAGGTPFQTGVAISPALWQAGGDIGGTLSRKADTNLSIWIGVGSREQGEASPDEARALRQRERAMVDRAAALGDQLAANWSEERVEFSILDGEDHASIVTASMARCLRFIFAQAGELS